jgi:pimeloyl-ACP methyl ester carboxylesterase
MTLNAHSLPRRFWRLLLLTAFAGAVGVGALLASSGSASSSPITAKKPAAKPTIVLVHGAWADSSSWSSAAGRLQDRGYRVVAVPNPLRGLASDAAYLTSFLNSDSVTGPVVLVGHSYGGAVITNAATSTPKVKALVYINAFAPDEGETLLQLVSARPGSALGGDPTQVFDLVPYPGGPPGDVDLYVKQSLFPDAFANDLSPKRGAILASTQRPLAFSAAGTPSGPPAWKAIPSWYLVGTADHVIPPAEQRFMADRAQAQTVEVKASHLSMISRPRAVTKLIIEAAHGTP